MADINIDTENFEPNKCSKRKSTFSETAMEIDVHNGIEGKSKNSPPRSKRIKTKSLSENKEDIRKIAVPAHRYSPLKENWLKIFTPIVEHLELQIRFNLKTRNVEIRTCEQTKDISNLQKAADFVKVCALLLNKCFVNLHLKVIKKIFKIIPEVYYIIKIACGYLN